MRNSIILFSIFALHINYILYNSIGIDEVYKNGIRFLVIALLLFTLLLVKNRIKVQWSDLLFLYLLSFSFLSFNITPNIVNFFYIILILIVAREYSLKEVLDKSFYIMIISAVSVVVLLQFGLTENMRYTIGDRTRNTLGFTNVNAFSNLVYAFAILYLLSRKEILIKHYIFVLTFVIVIYSYTDSRTVTVACLIFLLVHIILQFLFKMADNKLNGLIKSFLLLLVFFPIGITFLSPLLSSEFAVLDILTSGRLTRFTEYIGDNGVVNLLFGGTTAADKDNSYLLILFSTGILFSLMVLGLIVKAIFRLVDIKKSQYIAFIVSGIYAGAFESLLVRPEIIISICFWLVVYKSAFAKGRLLEKEFENKFI
ncbi:hypothetical protein M4S82_04065 [Planococcus sp. MERTA32b]|nr:hypothetical protein [Planococcus sp. MER TA 32b]